MPISMYQVSVPVFTQMLSSLSKVIDKAIAHVAAKKIDPAALLTARLYPDMFPFMKQVQSATEHARGGASRLAGLEAPRYEDKETSFEDLQARIARTLEMLKGLDPAAIDGSEDRDIHFVTGGRERIVKGQPYLLAQVLPNFFFHVTTAYDILRHNGVELGKRDFLNP